MILPASTLDLIKGTPIESNPVWADMAEAFDIILQRNVDGPATQLSEVRFLRDDYDQDILQKTCRMIGFDLSQDVLSTQTDLTKLVTQLPLYAYYNSTELFTRFVELLMDGSVEVTPLYAQIFWDPNNRKVSQDLNHYRNWNEVGPQGLLVTQGGTWVKTTHINLAIEVNSSMFNDETLTLKQNQTFYERIQEIFYEYAPIALVVRKLTFITRAFAVLRIGGTISGATMGTYTSIHSNVAVINNGLIPDDFPETTLRPVIDSYGDFVQLQRPALDFLGRRMMATAANRAIGRMLNNVPARGTIEQIPDLPNAVFPLQEFTATFKIHSIDSDYGRAIVKASQYYFKVFEDGASAIYAIYDLILFDPTMTPIDVRTICVQYYDASGIQRGGTYYFVPRSIAVTYDNLRTRINGKMLSSFGA